MPHDLGQIPGRRFNQKMIMVVHKTECVNNGIISLCGRLKIFKKLLPVALTFEYIFSFITSGNHMIKGPRIIYPQGTSQLSYISAVNILPYRIAITHIICQECRPDPSVFPSALYFKGLSAILEKHCRDHFNLILQNVSRASQ